MTDPPPPSRKRKTRPREAGSAAVDPSLRGNDEPVSDRGTGTLGDQAPRNVSRLDQLQRLLDITQECAVQASVARQRASRYSSYYRTRAEHFQKLAARARSAEMRASLLHLASLHEALAAQDVPAEGIEALRVGSSDLPGDRELLLDDERSSNAAECGEGPLQQRSAEHPIAQARRHVAEAQGHITRQETLIARLTSDDRHGALAAEAKEILDTLKHTLSLAQRHLELELKK